MLRAPPRWPLPGSQEPAEVTEQNAKNAPYPVTEILMEQVKLRAKKSFVFFF